MNKFLRATAVASLLAASGVAMAAIDASKTENWGTLTTAGKTFSHVFASSYFNDVTFTDRYNFSVPASTTAVTGTESDTSASTLWSLTFTQDVNVQSIQLYDNTTASYVPDSVPGVSGFTFGNLSSTHSYSLLVSGIMYASLLGGGGQYNGSVSLVAGGSSTPVASAAPEPAEMLLTALGLGGVAFWVRRQKRA